MLYAEYNITLAVSLCILQLASSQKKKKVSNLSLQFIGSYAAGVLFRMARTRQILLECDLCYKGGQFPPTHACQPRYPSPSISKESPESLILG